MAIYKIKGMVCEACVSKITSELEKNFQNIKIDLKSGKLELEGADSENIEIVKNYISQAGKQYGIDYNYESKPSVIFTFWPLILTTLIILGGVILLGIRSKEFIFYNSVLDFIGLFFIFFSFFKLLDIKKFAESFASYDVIAKKWYSFGLVYPFIEFVLGVMFLIRFEIFYAMLIAEVVMISGAIGVTKALFSGKKIQCACLGGLFNLPMTKVTLFEDFIILACLVYVAINM